MAEQWIKGFVVDERRLFGLVGSNDAALLERAMAEMESLLSELSMGERERADKTEQLETALSEVLSGALAEGHDRGYRNAIEIFLGVVGEELGEFIFPGRHWNFLTGWKQAGLGALGEVWGRTNASFPWKDMPRERPDLEGSVAIRLDEDRLTRLAAELSARSRERSSLEVVARTLYPDEDRDDDEVLDDAEELAGFLAELESWCAVALKRGECLYLWHAGAMA